MLFSIQIKGSALFSLSVVASSLVTGAVSGAGSAYFEECLCDGKLESGDYAMSWFSCCVARHAQLAAFTSLFCLTRDLFGVRGPAAHEDTLFCAEICSMAASWIAYFCYRVKLHDEKKAGDRSNSAILAQR